MTKTTCTRNSAILEKLELAVIPISVESLTSLGDARVSEFAEVLMDDTGDELRIGKTCKLSEDVHRQAESIRASLTRAEFEFCPPFERPVCLYADSDTADQYRFRRLADDEQSRLEALLTRPGGAPLRKAA